MKKFCNRCYDQVPSRQGGHGLCRPCYNAARRQGGDMPPTGTRFLTERPVTRAGATLRPMTEEEDDSPFEDATTPPGGQDLAGVIEVLEIVQTARELDEHMIRGCIAALNGELTNLGRDQDED